MHFFYIRFAERRKYSYFYAGFHYGVRDGSSKPESISVALSSDNVNFTEVGEKHFTPEEIFREGTYVEDLKFDLGTAKARYVRVTARGVGKCPPDHVRPGQEARIFFDEIIVE